MAQIQTIKGYLEKHRQKAVNIFFVAMVSGGLSFAALPLAADTLVSTQAPSPTPQEVESVTASPSPSEPVTTQSDSTITDSFEIMSATGLPGRIAFSANVSGQQQIFIADLDARTIRAVITGPGNNYYPQFSSDGAFITFVSDRDGNPEIYIAEWDGAEQRRISAGDGVKETPAFIPNSMEVVYALTRRPGDTTIVRQLPDSAARPIGIAGGKNLTPKVSPDGKRLAFSTDRFWPGWDVCVWDIAKLREQCPISGRSSHCRPDFSRDSNRIAFATGEDSAIDIAVYDPRVGQRLESITELPGREYDPVWSPDDTAIAFVSDSGSPDLFSIYTVELEKKRVSQVVRGPYSIRYLSWSGVRTIDLEAQRVRETERRAMAEAESSPLPETNVHGAGSPSPSESPATSTTP